MSDLFLTPDPDGADLTLLSNGQPQMTGGLSNAVYLSLFVPQTWADITRESTNRYRSRIPGIMATATVTNQTRLALIDAATEALQWMVDGGVVGEITVEAVIVSARRIDVTVRITGPTGDADVAFAVNWETQIAELVEAQ